MFITLNDISIARSSDRITKQLGWSATLPPGLADDRDRAYDMFSIKLDYSVLSLYTMWKYFPV